MCPSARILLSLCCCLGSSIAQAPGNFVHDRGKLPEALPAMAVRLRDMNADGRPDILRLRDGGLDLQLQDPATGRFQTASVTGVLATSSCRDLATGRFGPIGSQLPDAAVLLTDGSVEIFANTGSGLVQRVPRPIVPAVHTSPNQMLVGDVDGDGRDDVFVLMDGQVPNLFLASGSGFVDATATHMPANAGNFSRQRAALADLDGDGALDLVVAASSSTVPQILVNDGTGVFHLAPAGTLPAVPLSVSRIAVGQVAGSPLPEIVFGLAGTTTRAPVVYANNAPAFPGTFTAIPQGLLLEGVRDLALVDLDGDGWLDLVVLRSDGSLGYGLDDGAGRFVGEPTGTANLTEPWPILGEAPGRVAMANADVDGDGDVDFVTGGNGFEDQLLLRLAGAAIAFRDTESVTMPVEHRHRPMLCALVDRRGVGDLDLVGYEQDGSPELYRNDGSARFTEVEQRPGPGRILPPLSSAILWRRALAASIAAPGRRDVLVVGDSFATGVQVAVLTNSNGIYTDATATSWVPPPYTVAAVAVVPGVAGTDHVVACDYAGELTLCVNTNGVLAPAAVPAFPPGLGLFAVSTLVVGDVDGNGIADVVVLPVGGPPRVFLAQAGGLSFTEVPGAFASAAICEYGVLADIDGDGQADLLGCTQMAHQLRVWRGTGSGAFVDATPSLFGSGLLLAETAAPTVLDGVPRIVYGTSAGPTRMLTWNGSAYGNPQELPRRGASGAIGLLLGDLDQDGDEDLVVLRDDENPFVLRADTCHLAQQGLVQGGQRLDVRLVTPLTGPSFTALLWSQSTAPTPTPYGLLRVAMPAYTLGLALQNGRERVFQMQVPPGMSATVLPLQSAMLDLGTLAGQLGPVEFCEVIR